MTTLKARTFTQWAFPQFKRPHPFHKSQAIAALNECSQEEQKLQNEQARRLSALNETIEFHRMRSLRIHEHM